MEEHQITSGIWPTMITPFTAENKVDYGAIEKLLHFYWSRGVTSVFALCQSSEMFFLSLAEKKEMARFITSHAPAGMQVVLSGHTADSVSEQIQQAKEIFCPGAAAYVILPNRFAKPDEPDEVLISRMQAFIEGVPEIPLGIYECPYPYKRLLTPKVLQWCIDSGRFLFLKDTCCDLEQMGRKLEMIRGSGISLYNANSATLLESLKLGAAGYSGVMANFYPELYVWLHGNFKKEPEKAAALQSLLSTCSMAEYQYYPVNAKYCLRQQGVEMETASRVLPENNFTASKQLEILEMNRLVTLARKKLGIEP